MSRNTKQEEILQRNRKGFAMKNISYDQQEAPPTIPNDIQLLNLETHILRVHVNCDGCRLKVKKILRKIEGVYSVNIDVEEEKVTVRGKVESSRLIRKLAKSGKHAELWSSASNTDPSGDIKNHQLMEEEEEQNNETGEFEGLLDYKDLEMRRTPVGYGPYHQGYPGFYDRSAGYMYQQQQQHYPPSSSSMVPGLNIYSMMVDGEHRQIHPTWPPQDTYPLRVSHIWDY